MIRFPFSYVPHLIELVELFKKQNIVKNHEYCLRVIDIIVTVVDW